MSADHRPEQSSAKTPEGELAHDASGNDRTQRYTKTPSQSFSDRSLEVEVGAKQPSADGQESPEQQTPMDPTVELRKDPISAGQSAFQNANEEDRTVISKKPVAAPEEYYRSMPLAELSAMLEGRHLDHFSVEQIVGGGGMGAVFRGIDLRLNRVVAVKVIPASKRDPETLRRFRLEAQAAARLDHPNIARVYYVGEAEQWNYIVFEFIEGINIRDLVSMDGPLGVDDAVFYTRQVAEALQHAKQREVVHRDIKPSNVLVTPNGQVKVVDMGLARDTSINNSAADATASGMTLGTFDYISPEQAKNPRDADVRSDIYSLGCTLFFMLTGSPPFPDGTALQKLLNHGSQPPPDPRAWRDDLSDELVEIAMKMMAKRPSDRYQLPDELVNDLLLLAEYEELPRSLSPGTMVFSPPIPERSLLESNLGWLIALAFLIGSTLWLQSYELLSSDMRLPDIRLALPPNSLSVTGEESAVKAERPVEKVVPNEKPSGNPADKPLVPVGDPPVGLESRSNSSSLVGNGITPSNSTTGTGLSRIGLEKEGASSQNIIVSSRRPVGLMNVFWEPTLERAVRRVQPGQSIEVRGKISLPRPIDLSGQTVKIVGSGLEPSGIEVVPTFWSELDSDVPRASRAVFRISSGQLSIENLSISVSLPNDLAGQRGNIFSVTEEVQLRISESGVTIESEGETGLSIIHVAAVSDATGQAGLQRVQISNSMFRGPADGIAIVDQGGMGRNAIEIGIVNSIVALQGHTLVLNSNTDQASLQRQVRVSCQQSTFLASEGFAELNYSGMFSPVLGLSRISHDSVYWSTQGVPHISMKSERAGRTPLGNLVFLDGSNNSYDELMMNIGETAEATNQDLTPAEIGFDDAARQGWWVERATERFVRWKENVEMSIPFYNSVPKDFELEESIFSRGYRESAGRTPNLD